MPLLAPDVVETVNDFMVWPNSPLHLIELFASASLLLQLHPEAN